MTFSFFPFSNYNIVWIQNPFDHLLLPDSGNLNINYLQQFKDQLIVINMCSEHWNNLELTMYKQLEENSVNFLILTHDPDKHLVCPRLMFFEYWYHYSQQVFSINHPIDNNPKTYYVGCLNGNPRPHRIANYYKLLNKSYRDKVSMSFFNTLDNLVPDRDDDVELSEQEIDFWKTIKTTLPYRHQSAVDNSISIPQLSDCYLHIVSETTVIPGIFITEKTWKAVVTGVPFVMFGNPGTVNYLRRIGVDVFDNVIDHNYYDQEQDWRTRLEKIHQLIDDLVQQGIDKIYYQTLAQRKSNRQRFVNNEFKQSLKEIVSAIQRYSQGTLC